MNYAEYVVTGWVVTGAAVASYWLWVVRRTKRAEDAWSDGQPEVGAE